MQISYFHTQPLLNDWILLNWIISTDLLSVSEFEIEVDEVSGKAHPNETESAHGEIETQVEHSKLVLDNGPVLWDLPVSSQPNHPVRTVHWNGHPASGVAINGRYVVGP